MSQFFWMMLLVATGGAVGGALRLGISEWMLRLRRQSHFPWATTVVNLSGCFFLGAIAGWLGMPRAEDSVLWLLGAVGLIGALTTVSGFVMEVIALIRDRRFEMAGLYILVSLFGSLATFVAGSLSIQLIAGTASP